MKKSIMKQFFLAVVAVLLIVGFTFADSNLTGDIGTGTSANSLDYTVEGGEISSVGGDSYDNFVIGVKMDDSTYASCRVTGWFYKSSNDIQIGGGNPAISGCLEGQTKSDCLWVVDLDSTKNPDGVTDITVDINTSSWNENDLWIKYSGYYECKSSTGLVLASGGVSPYFYFQPISSIHVDKTLDLGPYFSVKDGSYVPFTITIWNTGSTDLNNFSLGDFFPLDVLDFVGLYYNGPTTVYITNYQPGYWTSVNVDIPARSSAEFRIIGKIKDDISTPASFVNTAVVKDFVDKYGNHTGVSETGYIYPTLTPSFEISPENQCGVSGKQINFDLNIDNSQNPLDCSIDWTFSFPSEYVDYVNASLNGYYPIGTISNSKIIVHQDLLAGEVTGVNITGLIIKNFVSDLEFNWEYTGYCYSGDFRTKIPSLQNTVYVNPGIKTNFSVDYLNQYPPAVTGEKIIYKLTITNSGGKVLTGYRLLLDFPNEDLDFGGLCYDQNCDNPITLTLDTVGPDYNSDGDSDYYTDLQTNLGYGQSDIYYVIGYLKTNDTAHNPINLRAGITGFDYCEKGIWSGENSVDIVRRKFDISVSPFSVNAVSGSDVSFDLNFANNGDSDCSYSAYYQVVPFNGFYTTNSWQAGVELSGILTPGNSGNFTLDGKVQIDSWNSGDFYLRFYGTYNCGTGDINWERYSYINPIPEVGVYKKLISVPPSRIGDEVDFLIHLKNTGSSVAENYSIIDTLPDSLSGVRVYISGTNTQLSYYIQDGKIYISDGYEGNNIKILPGDSLDVIISAILVNNVGGINNVEINLFDYISTNNNSGADFDVIPREFDIEVLPLVQYAISGDLVTFSISGSNNGTTDCDYEIRYTFPSGISWVSGLRPGVSYNSTLTAGDSDDQILIFTGKVDLDSWNQGDLPVDINVNYSCIAGEEKSYNMQAQVYPRPELIIEKTIQEPDYYVDNSVVRFGVKIKNIGSATASGYYVYDDLGAGLILLPENSPGWYRNGRFYPTLLATIPGVIQGYYWYGSYMNLLPGQEANAILETYLADGMCLSDQLWNNVYVTGAINVDQNGNIGEETDLNDGNAFSVSGYVKNQDLFVTGDKLEPNFQPVFSGDKVGFHIQFGNSGNIDADNVLLKLDFSGLTFESSSLNYTQIDGDTVSLDFANISTGTSYDLYVTGIVDSLYAAGTPLCVSYEIGNNRSENLCNLAQNNTGQICYYISGDIVDLSVTKTCDFDENNIYSGDELGFHIIVSNISQATGNFDLIDTLPNYVDFVSSNVACNQVDNKVSCENITILPKQNLDIYITGILTALPASGLQVENYVEIIATGDTKEFNFENNTATCTKYIPGLADLAVVKELIGEMPSRKGDSLKYRITVINSGYRDLSGIVLRLNDVMGFNGVSLNINDPSLTPLIERDSANASGYWIVGNIARGESKDFVLSLVLNDDYSARDTLITNQVCVTGDYQDLDLDNNCDVVTGTLHEVSDILLEVWPVNLSRQWDPDPHSDSRNVFDYTRGLTDLYPWPWDGDVYAVSGDEVMFRVYYKNLGNVPFTGSLRFQTCNGIDGCINSNVNNQFEYTDNDLVIPVGGTGVLTFRGVVGPDGYEDLKGIVTLIRVDSAGDQNYVSSGFVYEPIRCGDGYITDGEKCDIGTGNGVIGDLLPGQVCEIVGNDRSLGCRVRTDYIPNTGCVTYWYNYNGILMTGEVCSSMEPLYVAGASCKTVVTQETILSDGGKQVDFVCYADGGNENTYIKMDCGNGQIIEGFGTELTGTCAYSASLSTGEILYTGQCIVEGDNENPNCSFEVALENSEASCSNLVSVDGFVGIANSQDDYVDMDFECYTNGYTGKIEIDCDYDGTFDADYSRDGVDSLTYTCRYPASEKTIYNVACRVNDEEIKDDCKENIMIDIPKLGYCGDGKLDGIEQCDLGDGKNRIYTWLDSERTVEAPSSIENGDYYCENCAIKKYGTDSVVYTPPACLYISNANISVERGEIMPFWWNIENKKSIDEGGYCDPGDVGNVKCEFEILNPFGEVVDTMIKDCDTDNWDLDVLNSFEEKYSDYSSIDDAFGKYYAYVDDFVKDGDPLGEYRLLLNRVVYDYCDNDGEWKKGLVVDRVCQSNFVVTVPYLIQRTPFGTNFASDSDISLSNFYALSKGVDYVKLIDKTDLRDYVDTVELNDYDLSFDLRKSIYAFVDKYGPIAQKVNTTGPIDVEGGTINELRKVPGRQIYVIKGDGKLHISQKTNNYPATPFTIIVKGMDVEVDGSVVTNGMFIVLKDDNGNGGKITFSYKNEDDCDSPQVVNGIFIAEKGFDLTPEGMTKNDEDAQVWCDNGSLIVNGVLIGSNIDDLVKYRRAHLNNWFMVSGDEEDVQSQRTKMLFDGAAVLIQNSTDLWNNLPPGAEEFTQKLEVYRH